MTNVYGNIIGANSSYSPSCGWRSKLIYTTSTSNTAVTINVGGVGMVDGTSDGFSFTAISSATGSSVLSGYINVNGVRKWTSDATYPMRTDPGENVASVSITRTKAAQSIPVVFSFYNNKYGVLPKTQGASAIILTGTSTASVNVSVPAKPSYSITFNANDGSGAPSAQTKWYGETLTLSSTKPTRQFYQFDGWATSATGAAVYCTGADNASNTSYTANAAATLYAHWTRVHQPPTISSLTVVRCNANGDPDDEGTCCKAKVTWSVDTAVYSGNTGTTLTVSVAGLTGTESVNLSGTGTTTEVVYDAAELGTDSSYRVTATVTDAQSKATSRTSVLSMAFFTMDFKEGGHGIGIGKPANDEVDNLLDIAMNTRFNALATVQDTTSSSVAYDSGNPKIRFSNTNASQNGDLVFTDYDAVHTGATLAWITNQTQSWFHTQYVKATSNVDVDGTVVKRWPAMNYNTAPSATIYAQPFTIYDNAGNIVGHSEYAQSTNKSIQHNFAAVRQYNGSAWAWYQCAMVVSSAGAVTYSIHTPAAFRNALGASSGTWPQSIGGTGRAQSTANRTFWCGRILYDNNSGTNGTVTLAETAANFTFMFIGFKENDGYYDGMFVRSPNGKVVNLCTFESTQNGLANLKWKTVTISGTSMTTKNYADANPLTDSGSSVNHIYITHVIGFA